MNTKSITTIAIATVVAVVTLSMVLVPIVGSAMDEEKTVFNNNYNRYSKLIDSDLDNFSMNITWSDLTQGSITIKIGENDPYTLSISRSRVPLIMTPYGTVEENAVNSRGILRHSASTTYTYLTGGPISIDVANKVVTVTNGTGDDATTTTFNVGDWLFYPDDNGTYTAMNTTSSANDTIYLNSIDDLYFATTINTDNLGFVSGHGKTCTFYNVEDTPSYSMELINSEKVNGYTDIISTKITDYAISSEAGTNSDESQFVPFITMVPRAVIGHTATNNTMLSLFGIIPVFVALAIIVAVAGFIFAKYRK